MRRNSLALAGIHYQSLAFVVPGDVTLKTLLAPVIDQFKYVKQFPIPHSQEAVPKTLIHGTAPGSSGSKLSYQSFCFEMNFHKNSTESFTQTYWPKGAFGNSQESSGIRLARKQVTF